MSVGDRIRRAVREHLRTIESLDGLEGQIEDAARSLADCLRSGGTIWWMGNGGSASDCQHLAAELVNRYAKDRPGLASVALTTDTSILTSLGNDAGFERVFARQIETLCRPGDAVVAISTSGRSPNVLEGLRAAREVDAVTVGLLGGDGGPAAALVDRAVIVSSDNPARVQEAHILIGHIWCEQLEAGLEWI